MTTATQARLVTFRLHDDLFAADVAMVERVLRYSVPTAIPNMPPWIEGVIEYRDRVVGVIDFRKRFELEHTDVGAAARLLIFTVEGEWIAAVVDAVLEVATVDPSRITPPPPLFRGLSAEFLMGIMQDQGGLVVVLNINRILATHERLALRALGGAATNG